MSQRRRPAPPFNPQALVETIPRRVITERMLAHARINAEETIDRDVLRALRASAAAGTGDGGVPPAVATAAPNPPAEAARDGRLPQAWRRITGGFLHATRAVGRAIGAPFRRR